MAPLKEEPSETEKEIFEKIANNDVSGLKCLLMQEGVKPDTCDENGMTPLQHAAYKGNKDIVQMLLDQGADVNSGKHEHGYTALHFGALSGNAEVCQMLLMAGAKSGVTNSVGRTAAQMAAFVGNHKCVAVINSHIPKADVDYYTVCRGLETEPKLPPFLASPLLKFITQVNVHPVRVALNLQKAPLLMENLDKAVKVLNLMSEREMKRGFETNEVMAFKFHYLANVVAEINRCSKKQAAAAEAREAKERTKEEEKEREDERKKSDPTELFAKQMLKSGRGENATPEYQDRFLREIVREFPYRESTVFRQMVTSLAQRDSPSAYSVISATINGQRGFIDVKAVCWTCAEEDAPKKCSKCKAVQYCDRECQRLHWFMHKKSCARLSQSPKEPPSDNKSPLPTSPPEVKAERKSQTEESLSSQVENLNV